MRLYFRAGSAVVGVHSCSNIVGRFIKDFGDNIEGSETTPVVILLSRVDNPGAVIVAVTVFAHRNESLLRQLFQPRQGHAIKTALRSAHHVKRSADRGKGFVDIKKDV
jgi:hypothetical protein